jgi:hypothetical protein
MTFGPGTPSERMEALFSERSSERLPPRDRDHYLYGHTPHDFVKPSGLHARTEPKLIGTIRCFIKHCDCAS